MTKRNYNFAIADEKKVAKAFSSNVPVSVKFSTEMARELKGMKVAKAERFLQDIVEKKRYLPLRKYTRKVGHRKGASQSYTEIGRYPLNVSKAFLSLLNTVKANADYKGLDTENLVIAHMFASQGFSRRSHQKQGRISGKTHQKKSAHLEVVVRETK